MSSRSANRSRGSHLGKRAAPRTSRRAAPPTSSPAEAVSLYTPPRRLLTLCFVLLATATATLVVCAFDVGPTWLDPTASVVVVTCLSWLLASRTAGRAFVCALVAATLGTTAVVVGGTILPTGASVMTCVVGGVYAVMATVPAVTLRVAVRELLIATGISVVTALGAVGFGPTVSVERYDITTVVVALVLAASIVHRLGAGLHGLGRRGQIAVGVGVGAMVVAVAYAEVLRRYGAQDLMTSIFDFVEATSDRIGAFPRPLMVFLGVPALLWGVHLRARRRQGWWVCTFGVAATVPMAAGLVAPDASYLEAFLRAAYSLVLGLVVGYLVIRADVALTSPRGGRRGGRRAEQVGAVRPEPGRFSEL